MSILFYIIGYLLIGFVITIIIAVSDALKGCVRTGDKSMFGVFFWPILIIFISSELLDKLVNGIVEIIVPHIKKENK